MRLWSVHPQYLDAAGLVALWREGLLAQAVIAGRTNGYRSHPQLQRFREQRDPGAAIAAYLHVIADEAQQRGYSFDRGKILRERTRAATVVSRGQLRYELLHLKRKVRGRNADWYARIRSVRDPLPHPRSRVVPGGIAPWERRSGA